MWLDKLKEMKKESRKTSQQLADETGIPKSTIDKLFSGKTKEPYLQSTRLLVHAMGYTLDDLDDLDDSFDQKVTDIQKEQLISNYDQLNELGRKKLVEYSDDLINIENYTGKTKEKRA